jgi:tryptophan 2,3-dioxygenase
MIMRDPATGTRQDMVTPRSSSPYGDYIHERELLGSCCPVTNQAPERIFIRNHQICELLFASVLDSLERAIDALLDGRYSDGVQMLAKCRILTDQSADMVAVLPELVSPDEFREFRTALGGASGMQSAQFRRIECVSGGFGDRRTRGLPNTAQRGRGRAKAGRRTSTLWDAFLAAADLDPQDPKALRTAGLIQLLERQGELADIAEALRHHDLAWRQWRQTHADMVRRMIGVDVAGTGGTEGFYFLRRRARLRWYGELHAAHACVVRRARM